MNTNVPGTYTGVIKVQDYLWKDPDKNYVLVIQNGDVTVLEKEESDGKYPVKFPEGQDPGEITINGDNVSTNDPIDSTKYGNTLLVTSYLYNDGNRFFSGAHTQYPTNMSVWELTLTETNGEKVYVAKKVEQLENFLNYYGTSIRVNFTSNGIRFFTQVHAEKREKLINGTLLDGNLAGYKLVGYGTVFTWADGKSISESEAISYAYIAGTRDSVFSRLNGYVQYTGMLTGLGSDKDTLNRDLLARPYFVMERKNADGTTDSVTLYGGQIQRSISYVAQQNKDHWATGSAYDNYIENIIAIANS